MRPSLEKRKGLLHYDTRVTERKRRKEVTYLRTNGKGRRRVQAVRSGEDELTKRRGLSSTSFAVCRKRKGKGALVEAKKEQEKRNSLQGEGGGKEPQGISMRGHDSQWEIQRMDYSEAMSGRGGLHDAKEEVRPYPKELGGHCG